MHYLYASSERPVGSRERFGRAMVSFHCFVCLFGSLHAHGCALDTATQYSNHVPHIDAHAELLCTLIDDSFGRLGFIYERSGAWQSAVIYGNDCTLKLTRPASLPRTQPSLTAAERLRYVTHERLPNSHASANRWCTTSADFSSEPERRTVLRGDLSPRTNSQATEGPPSTERRKVHNAVLLSPSPSLALTSSTMACEASFTTRVLGRLMFATTSS